MTFETERAEKPPGGARGQPRWGLRRLLKIRAVGMRRGPDGVRQQPPSVVLKPFTDRPSLPWRVAGRIGIVLLGVACVLYGFGYALTTPFMLKEFISPLVPLACFAIWALPASKAKPTRALEGLFWAFLMSVMLWPSYLMIKLPGLPAISAVRLVGLPMAVVLLVRLSTSKTFQDEVRATVRAVPHLGAFMAAFVAIQVLTIGVSAAPGSSANLVFDNQIGWTAAFFIACYIFRQPGSVERAIGLFCVCAVGLCFLGLWETRVQHVIWSDHVPSFFEVDDPAVQRALSGVRRNGIGAYRTQSVQSTSLGFAEFLAMAMPFLIHFMGRRFRLFVRILAGLSIPLVFVVILLTHSRLGMVGFFLSSLLYLILWAMDRWKNTRGSLIGPAVVAAYPAIFCGFIAASFFVTRLKVLIWGNGETKYSNESRSAQLQTGIPLVLSHPWGFGTGIGAARLGFTEEDGTGTIDNYLLLTALDWGIAGLIIYFGMIILLIWAAGRQSWARSMRSREHTFLVPASILLIEFFVIKTIFQPDSQSQASIHFHGHDRGADLPYPLWRSRR
jgi:hypothetical protein